MPLLPIALNEILPRIDVGMTREQVVSLLAEKYPAVKTKQGLWSGQSGYMDFILDERYEIDVSAVNTPPGTESPTVNKDFIIYILTSHLNSALRSNSTTGSSSSNCLEVHKTTLA